MPLQCCFSTFSQYFYQLALPWALAAHTGSNKHQLSLESSVFLGQAHCLIGITWIFTSSAKPPRPKHLCLCALTTGQQNPALKDKSLHNNSIKSSQFQVLLLKQSYDRKKHLEKKSQSNNKLLCKSSNKWKVAGVHQDKHWATSLEATTWYSLSTAQALCSPLSGQQLFSSPRYFSTTVQRSRKYPILGTNSSPIPLSFAKKFSTDTFVPSPVPLKPGHAPNENLWTESSWILPQILPLHQTCSPKALTLHQGPSNSLLQKLPGVKWFYSATRTES